MGVAKQGAEGRKCTRRARIPSKFAQVASLTSYYIRFMHKIALEHTIYRRKNSKVFSGRA